MRAMPPTTNPTTSPVLQLLPPRFLERPERDRPDLEPDLDQELPVPEYPEWTPVELQLVDVPVLPVEVRRLDLPDDVYPVEVPALPVEVHPDVPVLRVDPVLDVRDVLDRDVNDRLRRRLAALNRSKPARDDLRRDV